MVAAVMGGMSPRQYLSAGFGALMADSEGNPFNGSWVIGSGNIAADMLANAAAESTGLALVCRLNAMTDDPGMKDMFKYLIARDVMHQQQWLAVLEELGGLNKQLPIPNSFDYKDGSIEKFQHAFFTTSIDGIVPPTGRFNTGPSLDGRGRVLDDEAGADGRGAAAGGPDPEAYAQTEQMVGGKERVAAMGQSGAGKSGTPRKLH